MSLVGRIALSAVVLTALLFNAQAQDNRGNNAFGIKAGLSMSSFYGDGAKSLEDNLLGSVNGVDPAILQFVTGGLFFTYHLIPDFLSIQPEVLYLRSGKQWDVTSVGTTTNLKVYSDYLDIPVLIKLEIPLTMPVVPSVFVGPDVLIKLRSQAENIGDLPTTANLGFLANTGTDIKDLVNNATVGLTAGLGLALAAGPGDIVLDGRYRFDFIDAFKSSAADNVKNSAFLIMAGYALRF